MVLESQSQQSNEVYQTKRPTVDALEEILGQQFKVLDHGFVRVVDYMGNDAAIVQAARVSYGSGTKTLRQDQGLLDYLLKHDHSSPFEMCEIKFHIKLPIFIARQWIRHRTANVNEYSARYSILSKEFYIPNVEDIATQSKDNKQGRADVLDREQALEVQRILMNDATRSYETYEKLINTNISGEVLDDENEGIARELARINLSLNYYTEWYWKIDLLNLLKFLRLRSHHHAQLEIRRYAEVMMDILKLWMPMTYNSFLKHKVNSLNLSQDGVEAVKRMLLGERLNEENCGMSKRDWRELVEALGIKV